MIKNEHQYRITKKLALELESALAELPKHHEFKALNPKMQKAHVSSLKRQLQQHHNELRDYETLAAGKFDFSRLPALDQIPRWLIQARIAKGLRQEDLAKLLKVKKQQIQQYEATDYASASLMKIQQVAHILHQTRISAQQH